VTTSYRHSSPCVSDEEKYHLKNSLYTACKTGDKDSLKSLLAVIFTPAADGDRPAQQTVGTQQSDSTQHTDIGTQQIDETQQDNGSDRGSAEQDIVTVSQQLGHNEQCVKLSDDIDKSGNVKVSEEDMNLNHADQGPSVLECSSSLSNSNQPVCDTSVENTPVVQNHALILSANMKNDNDVTQPHRVSESSTLDTTNSPPHSDNSLPASKPSSIPVSSRPSRCQNSDPLTPVFVSPDILSEPMGDNHTTLLHVAAKEGHAGIVILLLEAGASPVLR